MTITLEIGPEARAELARRAAEKGSPAEVYAATLIEDALGIPSGQRHRQDTFNDVLTEDRLERAFREIAKYSDKIPALPNSAFTRESFYQDHD